MPNIEDITDKMADMLENGECPFDCKYEGRHPSCEQHNLVEKYREVKEMKDRYFLGDKTVAGERDICQRTDKGYVVIATINEPTAVTLVRHLNGRGEG